jgi:predicted kinase
MTNKLYIFCGIPFSGKSTLTKRIAEQKSYTRIDLDEEKFKLYGDSIQDAELQQKDWGVIYQATYKEVEAVLKVGQTVIYDTGNFTKYERDLVRHIADNLNIETLTVFVDTPEDIARQRLIANRQTNTRFNVTDQEFEEAVAEMEPPDKNEPYFSYSYDEPDDVWLEKHFV